MAPSASRNLVARLRNPEDLLGPLSRIPGAMFFVKDEAYRYVVMSDAVREVIGIEAEESPVGKTDFDLFPPLIAESYRRNDRHVIEKGRSLLDEVHVVVDRHGKTILVYSSKWPLYGRDGEIVGLVGTNRSCETGGARSGDGDDAGRLLPAVTRMLHDFGDPLPIGFLARECGLSASHFMRLFKRTMQVTAHEFLEKVRISQACDCLRSKPLPIATIARQCGFYDHSAFVKRFRRHTGITPLAYRKSGRGKLAGDIAAAVRD